MRPAASSILTALASTVLGLVALETALATWRPLERPRFEPDARLLFRLQPGFHTSFLLPQDDGLRRIDFAVNSQGFRGGELTRSADRLRVVVYGDSFIEGYSTPLAETFVVRLGESLNRASGRSVEAVNAGVGGYGPDQVGLRLETELDSLSADAIVLALFAGNDFGDLVRNKIFRLDAGGALVKGQYRLSPGSQATLAPTAWRRLALWRAFGFVRRRLFETARGAAAEAQPGSIAWALHQADREWHDYRAGDPLVSNLFVDHYEADMSLRPDSEAARTKRRLMTKLLASMRREVGSRGRLLLAVVIPAPEDLRSGPQADELALHPQYRPSALSDALAAAVREAGIACLDLYAPFRARGGDSLYYRHDLHWNAEAQALAAGLAARALLERGVAR